VFSPDGVIGGAWASLLVVGAAMVDKSPASHIIARRYEMPEDDLNMSTRL
jgi:hypothetical protein